MKTNTPLTENALPRAIKRIEDRLGIPSWTAHDFSPQCFEAAAIGGIQPSATLLEIQPQQEVTYEK